MTRIKTVSDEAVLDAALAVMITKGPSDFTLADIAGAAGIAPATLIQRFGTKHRLVVAAFARDNTRFVQSLSELPFRRSEEAVIDVFRLLSPNVANIGLFADQLLWLRQDMRDKDLNRLARQRFRALREAVALRMPRLGISTSEAALLAEAQWQGALSQWGIQPQGKLGDFVARRLRAWFSLARRN